MQSKFYKSLGRNLRRVRVSRGLSAAQLADLVGMSTDSVLRYERGERQLSVELMIKFAVVLGSSVMSFLDGLDPRTATGGPALEYNLLSPESSHIMRWLATSWKGDIEALVRWDGCYAVLPPKYRRDIIMYSDLKIDEALRDGAVDPDDFPPGLDYVHQRLGAMYQEDDE